MDRPALETAGLFDLQVNGFAGIDFNDEHLTPDGLDHALERMLATGVTQCLPTLITATEPELAGRFAALDAAVGRSRLGPIMVPGYHLEGPFLNPEPGFRGCHPAGAMRTHDKGLLERLTAKLRRPIRLLTLAAELPGAERLIAWAVTRGMLVSIGHSDAGAAVVERAAAAGARMSTHLGNGLPQMLPKLDNPLMAQLSEDRLVAGFIADGIHVPVPALRAMIRAKGPGRAVLVTDAVSAAATPPGRYEFAGMPIDGALDGSVRTPGPPRTLAGSALTLDRAVRNVVAWGITPDFAAAVSMASSAPARLLGLSPRGRVEWTADGQVAAAAFDELVYRSPA
jgi:N-acetylglucosamine-6-phosphate deacetylase